jgi:DUF971 family protein
MDAVPRKLNLKKDESLTILWSNGRESVYPIQMLRSRCPCAGCKELRTQMSKSRLTVLPDTGSSRVAAVTAQMVGNYAVRIEFSDGHDSGIFSFAYLWELAG